MAIVEFNKDGQGFYNFEALLEATSQEFVDTVKSYLEFSDEMKNEYDVKVRFLGEQVYVYVFFARNVNVFRYYNGEISDFFLMDFEVKLFSEVFGHGS